MTGTSAMTRIKLQRIDTFKDRHGHVRHYYKHKGKRTPLSGIPGSAEFMAAYAAAHAASQAPPAPIGSSRLGYATVAAAVAGYLTTARFKRLSDTSKKAYLYELEKLRVEHGDKRMAGLKRRHVRDQLEALSDRPSMAIARLNALRMIVKFAMNKDWIDTDPTAGVEQPRLEGDGYKAWSEDDIHSFEARHPIGTRARLAFGLALYTGQRRSDIVRMARADMRDGKIAVRQSKTGARLVLPIHPALASIIAGTPVVGLTHLLTTARGTPFSPTTFSGWFAKRIEEAGLSGLSVHGLRKTAAIRLAEAGASVKQIMAVTGHATVSEVQRYTAGTDQERMASDAMALIRTRDEQTDANPFANPTKKINDSSEH